MLDRKSRLFLRKMRATPDKLIDIVIPETGLPRGCKNMEDYYAMLKFLAEEGLLLPIPGGDGKTAAYRLSHTARNPFSFRWISFRLYVIDNWIAFIALVVSVVAFIRTL